MTQTKEFNLSKNTYAKIVMSTRLRRSWWLYLLLPITAAFHINKFGKDSFSSFFVVFAFCYPIVLFLYLYFWAISSGHNPILGKTNLSFDEEFLYIKRNADETKLVSKNIQKVLSKKEYWMLYISKGLFIYVPKNIFYSEEDLKKFIKLINAA